MLPKRLKLGDKIRVIAPSRNMGILHQETIDLATRRLSEMGLLVSFGQHVGEEDYLNAASVKGRLDDLHDAFRDESVKGILTVIGGFNVNSIIDQIDYDLIRENPKILCGFSDITALTNSIFHKTGLVTYQGPHYSTFGMLKGNEYTIEWFKKVLFEEGQHLYHKSKTYSDDPWYLDQENRRFLVNDGPWILHEGVGSGTIVGGNLSTFQLLHGTEFMPVLYDTILFIEADETCNPETFERMFQSLIHQPDFKGVKGILIGRFQKASKMTKELLEKMINSKRALDNIPIIANVDFGHTTPRITYPIGGRAIIDTSIEDKIIII